MFTRQIAKFIASERLLSHDARVLVALSGGADSVALFCVQSLEKVENEQKELQLKLQNRIMVLDLQKEGGFGAVDILPSNEFAEKLIADRKMGAALSVIASTYDDRSDRENAALIVDALLIQPLSNDQLIPLLVDTIAAKNVPKALDDVLSQKISDGERRKAISRAFQHANRQILLK